jgi:hypothetical protein
MPQPSYEIVSGRVPTRSLEVHIVDHCNLKCHACCSLSPYLPNWYIDPTALERDLQLARGALAPGHLKLVGGEPLLHPDLDGCLAVARRASIAPVVSVTTNGFLLPRMSDRFWELTQALTISLYPLPRLPNEIIALVERRASDHGIPVNWKQQREFVAMDLDAPRLDIAATRTIYDDCWLRRRCHIVSHGRFYTCTRPPHFDTFYGRDVGFQDDGLLLDTEPDMAARLRAYLRRPEPLKACALCRGGSGPSESHRQMSAGEIRAARELRRA